MLLVTRGYGGIVFDDDFLKHGKHWDLMDLGIDVLAALMKYMYMY